MIATVLGYVIVFVSASDLPKRPAPIVN